MIRLIIKLSRYLILMYLALTQIPLLALDNHRLLNQPKTFITQDPTTFGVGFANIPDWQGFQLNFTTQPLENVQNNQLVFGLTYMGHYRGEGYNFKKKLALIKFQPQMLTRNIIPQTLAQSLARQFNTRISHLNQSLQNKDITFTSMILGVVQEPERAPQNNTYNIIYHAWVGNWPQYRQNDRMPFFNPAPNVLMGAFNPDGVFEPQLRGVNAIAFNRFTAQNVNWHAPAHLSPNNARVGVDPQRAFSTFWSAALSQNKQRISVTYILLANNQQAEQWIAQILNRSRNLQEVSANIRQELPRADWLSNQDKQAIRNWINTIFSILGVNRQRLIREQLQAQQQRNREQRDRDIQDNSIDYLKGLYTNLTSRLEGLELRRHQLRI